MWERKAVGTAEKNESLFPSGVAERLGCMPGAAGSYLVIMRREPGIEKRPAERETKSMTLNPGDIS